MNPLKKFESWFNDERKLSQLRLPATCCLSTIGVDGYPNARFISLKEVTTAGFVITGTFSSQKGIEIEQKPTAALTFWWTATERQVRIQGDVVEISQEQASQYFKERNTDSQLVSTVFDQGKRIKNFDVMQELFQQKKEASDTSTIDKPKNWSGICIQPKRIEFMEFKTSRLHERTVFEGEIGNWKSYFLQP
jgi:pyridoxamine 5'-phosphate oxidase